MSEPEDSQEVATEEDSQEASQQVATEQEPEGSVSQQLGFSGPEEERDAIAARMDEIREEVTADLLANWPSPWKNDSMVNAKVGGRLGSHKAFQVLLARKRELDAELGTEAPPRVAEEAEDPMGSYANKIAREKAQQA